jgi:3-phosphoshikimate 1-carboxyvinyltransferase
VPSDKSIGHRALLFAALAEGESRITGYRGGEDNESTAGAFRAMGVRIEHPREEEIRVHGTGMFGLVPPTHPLDCGNSGTTMRLLAGVLAAQPFETTLIGDASLSRRPMMRIAAPLRARGARVEGKAHPTKEGDITAPLVIGPCDKALGPLEYASPVSSAQVKSAILLSGLYAEGPTYFREPMVSRDHTERMMSAMGVPLRASGPVLELDPSGWDQKLRALDVEIPGDISAAAFLLTAAAIVPGSRVRVERVGTNPTRTGFLEIARDMGASFLVEPKGETGGEPIADLEASHSALHRGRIGGELVPRAVDEIPIVCALAARANGVTEIRDAEELRVKESDRIATMAGVLAAFGVEAAELPDGLRVTGRDGALRAAEVHAKGDHRIAMTSAILGLCADGPSLIHDADCIRTSFPDFVALLNRLGAHIETVS